VLFCHKLLSSAPTAFVTAKRQQRDPLAFLQTLIADGPEAAKPMLYRIPPELDDSS